MQVLCGFLKGLGIPITLGFTPLSLQSLLATAETTRPAHLHLIPHRPGGQPWSVYVFSESLDRILGVAGDGQFGDVPVLGGDDVAIQHHAWTRCRLMEKGM